MQWLVLLALAVGPPAAPPSAAEPTIPAAAAAATAAPPPASETPATDPAPSTDPEAEAYVEQAPLDVQTLLTDTSRAYLEARARLEAHPEIAAEAIFDRLEAIPPPGPAERKRLLDVLAALGRPEDVALFAGELRRAVSRADNTAHALEIAERWRPLVRAGGPEASDALQALVGDRALPEAVRGVLLEDLVQVTPSTAIGDLAVLLGRGSPGLRDALRRALARRAAEDAVARAALVAGIERELATALDPATGQAARIPGLIHVRSTVHRGHEPALVEQLRALALDESIAFPTRVGAVRGLGVIREAQAERALAEVARHALAPGRRETQSGEILGWLAMDSLDGPLAPALATELALRREGAPRLAQLGYRLAPLPPGHDWLREGLANPWPQVRQAALRRVEGPCPEEVVDRLEQHGGPTSRGGDADRAVARASIQALGRCGGDAAFDALEDLLEGERVDPQLRAEAARQLVRRAGSRGVNEVADALEGDPPFPLARRLIVALRYAPAPTEDATEALCARLAAQDELAYEAAQTLRTLHPSSPDACQ